MRELRAGRLREVLEPDLGVGDQAAGLVGDHHLPQLGGAAPGQGGRLGPEPAVADRPEEVGVVGDADHLDPDAEVADQADLELAVAGGGAHGWGSSCCGWPRRASARLRWITVRVRTRLSGSHARLTCQQGTGAVMRVAIYARISRDSSGISENVDIQIMECRRYAEDRGWEVGGTWTDNDISASKYSTKPRPGYNTMITALKNDGIEAVLVV